MGFVSGSSCFLHHPSLFNTSSSQCSLQPPFLISSLKIAPTHMKNRVAMACLKPKNPKDSDSCARRVVLFMGFGVIPLLNIRLLAIDGLNAENTEVRSEDQKQDAKGSSSRNAFFALMNALGFLGSGVLAAFYASALKEKATSDATLESMNIELKAKETAITSLEKKIESELLNEKEIRYKALAKADEEKQSLLNQLKLADDTITSLGQELRKLNKLVDELSFRVNDLEASLEETNNEKSGLQEQLKEKLETVSVLQDRINLLSLDIQAKEDIVRSLDSKLADKEREINQLSSGYRQSQDQLNSLNSELKKLKDSALENEKELEFRGETVKKLDAELKASLAEKHESSKKLDGILREYYQLKSFMEEKSVSDAKILGEKEEKIQYLEEQLKFYLHEAKKNEVIISELSREGDEFKEMLNTESKNVKILEKEVVDLQEERKVMFSLKKELKVLEAQNLKDKEARKGLESDLDEASKALKEISRNSLTLSRELEIANSTISSMENERNGLHKVLDLEKRAHQEARDNLEEARDLVVRLGRDGEFLDKRGKKLEEELASAKGEILRLRTEINSLKTSVIDAGPTTKATSRGKVDNTKQEDA